MFKLIRATTIGFSAALLLASSAAAQSVTLKPKFTAGKTDYCEQVETIEQHIKGPMAPDGMTIKIKQVSGLKRSIEAAEKDKARVKFTFDRLASAFDGPMMPPMDYDSDRKENDADALTYEDIYKHMLGESIKAEFDADGRYTSVTGMKDVVAKVDKEISGNMFWPEVKKYFTDESFMMDQSNYGPALLPSKEVKPGDTWSVTLRDNLPSVGVLSYDTKCTLKSVDKKDGRSIANIEFDGKLTGEPTKSEPDNMGMTAKMESAELKGNAEFDLDAGEFVQTKIDKKMTLQATMGGGAPDASNTNKVTLKIAGAARAMPEKARAEQKKANADKPAEKPSEKPAAKSEKPETPK